MGVDSVDHCKCRDKHCGPKDEDSAAAKIHTNKLLDKAFYKAQCPSYEHMICERAVNCGFDHDKAANARRSLGGDCDNVKYPADDHNKEHQQVIKSGRQKAALQAGAGQSGSKKPRDDRDVYGMHNCDPHKYYKSGYGGYIPFTNDLVGMNSTAESHVGLNRMTDALDRNRCLKAMCREKYLNFDPCEVTKDDVKRPPGWMQPDKAYDKCIRKGFKQDGGAASSLPIGNRCESDRNAELRALMEADFKKTFGEDDCPGGKGDKCDCSPEEKKKKKEEKKEKEKKKDDCGEGSKCPSAKIDIGRRVVYDKKRGQVPGYGGHIPGLHVCTQGSNFGNLSRKVLKQTVSSERLRKGKC